MTCRAAREARHEPIEREGGCPVRHVTSHPTFGISGWKRGKGAACGVLAVEVHPRPPGPLSLSLSRLSLISRNYTHSHAARTYV